MAALTGALIASTIVAALTAAGSAYQQNQQTQHAKGAAEAQQKLMEGQVDAAKKLDANAATAKAQAGSATQAAALAALRASMSAGSGFGGSLLTNPSNSALAPTQGKTLLGV